MSRQPTTLPLPVLGVPLLLCLLPVPAAAARLAEDPPTWAASAHGVAITLTPLLPDPVRAFYLNRGFAAADIEAYATACVFTAVIRNDSAPGEIHYRLADWRIEQAGSAMPVPAVERWLAGWPADRVGEAARIAFRWAQIPSEQAYAPGEWNQGMLAIGLPPAAGFDLVVRWTLEDRPYTMRLDNVRCAD